MSADATGEEPVFVMGFRVARAVRFPVILIISWAVLFLAGNETAAVGAGIQLEVWKAIGLAASFSVVLTGLGCILMIVMYLRVGTLYFFESHVTWKVRRDARELGYSDLTDAYFGEYATPSGTILGVPGGPPKQMVNVRNVVSFYIGDRKFLFRNARGAHGEYLLSFLRERIPKENIDVDQ